MNDVFPAQPPLAFVTGATGLLGNNLVRELLAQGFRVRALVRLPEKAEQQFAGLAVEIVTGDMLAVEAFAPAFAGVDIVFHTAAYFRDSYTGGSHWPRLHAACPGDACTSAACVRGWSAAFRACQLHRSLARQARAAGG